MKTFQRRQIRVNILVDQTCARQWQAKVYGCETAALLHTTPTYRNSRSAYEDAQTWVDQRCYHTSSVVGIRMPRPHTRPHKLRSYSASWSGG